MSDKERAKILKSKRLTVVPCDTVLLQNAFPNAVQQLETLRKSEVTPLLLKIGKEFGALQSFQNADIDISFRFSRNGMEESLFKQGHNFDDYAKLLSCFRGVVENAVGVEAHTDRYNSDRTLKGVYVLLGAFSDDNKICPVKLEVKHFNDEDKNKLHIAITKTQIKKADVYGWWFGNNPDSSDPRSAFDISIHQFVKKINTSDGDLLKYFPDKLLTHPQRRAAEDARAAEALYTERKIAEQTKRAVRGKEIPPGTQSPKPLENGKALRANTPPSNAQARIKASKGNGNKGK